MDSSDILFWIGLFAIYLFRQFAGKKRKSGVSGLKAIPETRHSAAVQHGPSEAQRARPDQVDAFGPTDSTKVASPRRADGQVANRANTAVKRSPPTMEEVLMELRKAFTGGGAEASTSGSTQPTPEPPELFYESEQDLDALRGKRSRMESGFRSHKSDWHERTSSPEFRRPGSFERSGPDALPASSDRRDWESSPLPEVDFHDTRRGHPYNSEFHSPLETHTHPRENRPDSSATKREASPAKRASVKQHQAATSQPVRSPLISKLTTRSTLKEAVILSEILKIPPGRRPRQPRRPLS